MDRVIPADRGTVSVIIPTHMRPNLLAEAIASVIAQTQPATEIIVVDDADDAATRKLVSEMAQLSPVSVLYLSNKSMPGACGSRNLGADQAFSEAIAFLDDDDVWRPEFLRELMDRLWNDSLDFVMSGLYRHEEGCEPQLRMTPPGLTSSNVVADPRSMTGTNVVYRRKAFLSVGGFDRDVPVFNDWDLFIRLVDAGLKYDVVPLGLADWRWHNGDRIATFSLKRARGLRLFLRKYGARMKLATYRDFKTTAIGIERRHASGFKRFIKSGELFLAHGPGRTIGRALRKSSTR
jgi:glycosyltransferase involved in cell wall biosynthesis